MKHIDTILPYFDTFKANDANYECFNTFSSKIKSVKFPLNQYFFIQCLHYCDICLDN